METLIIELTNQKAYGLLRELEDLQLIRILKEPKKLSSLRGQIKSPMDSDLIDRQLSEMRSEWNRDI